MPQQTAPGGTQRGAYTFQQQPKVVGQKNPSKYRNPNSQTVQAVNIHHDKRVVKGSTYAAQVVPLSAQNELAMIERDQKNRRKQIMRQNRRKQEEEQKRSLTPEPVEGRKHIEIQTEQYLEELTDKVDELTAETQTDPMLDRPPTPKFVPFKSGRDAETQIEEGDLFNFDYEVQPMLDVMVGKTLEQAMLEVMQEEELQCTSQKQLEFEQRRKEEAIETQRLEAAEARRFKEKEARKKQEQDRLRRERVTREKLESRTFSKRFLGNLENRVFARLEDEGWFYDAVEREVETDFMPWLTEAAEQQLDKMRKTRSIVDELVRMAAKKAESLTSRPEA